MRTEELIRALSAHPPPVDPAAAQRRFESRLAMAGAIAAVLTMVLFPPRSALALSHLPLFWLKLAAPLGVALAAWVALRRLGIPGRRVPRTVALGAAPALLALGLGLASVSAAPAGERATRVFGSSWAACVAAIALLSLPSLLLALLALRHVAPTRPRLAGAVAGLFAGGACATAYALYCPEMSAPFLALWYPAGMLVAAVAGAGVGPRLLRW